MENSKPKWMLLLLPALLASATAFAAGPSTMIDQRELVISSSIPLSTSPSTSSNSSAINSRYYYGGAIVLSSDYRLGTIQRTQRHLSELGNDGSNSSDGVFFYYGQTPQLKGFLLYPVNQRSAIAPGYFNHLIDPVSTTRLPALDHSRFMPSIAIKTGGQFTVGNVMMGGDFNQLRLLVSLSQADSALVIGGGINSLAAPVNTTGFSSNFDPSTNLNSAPPPARDLALKHERFEAQLSSNSDRAIQWLVGMYQQTTALSADYSVLQSFEHRSQLPLGSDQFASGERAVFGGGSLELPGNINLSVGLRYLDYDLSRRLHSTAVTEGPASSAIAKGIGDSSRSSEEASNYRVTLSWDYSTDSQAYISMSDVAHGHHRLVLDSTQEQVVVCEQGVSAVAVERSRVVGDNVENIELGLRAEPSRGLRINAALYRTQWADSESRLNPLSRCGVNLSGNASAVVSTGLELGMAAALTEYLTINAGLGYSDGQFSEPVGAGSSQQLSEAPELSWSLSADWSRPIGDGELFVFGSVSYVDESSTLLGLNDGKVLRFTREGSQLKSEQTLVDVRLGYSSGDRWRAAVFIDNLTDEKMRYSADQTVMNLPEYDRGTRSRPRTVGVSASYSF